MPHSRPLTRYRRILAIASTTIVTVAAVTAVTAQPASAATFFSVNSSDPNIGWCGYGDVPLCIYTSEDMGTGTTADGNQYPMQRTLLFTLSGDKDAKVASNWTQNGSVVHEDQLEYGSTHTPPGPGVPSNMYHLWAPGVLYDHASNRYKVYEPELTNRSQQHTSSRVFVFDGASPSGPFSYVGQVNTPSSPNSGNASDPFLAWETLNGGAIANYMYYANGDFDNCGGLSQGTLGSNWTSISSVHTLTIDGLTGLGNCYVGSTAYPAYMEGPAAYFTPDLMWTSHFPGGGNYYGDWTLIFSLKPGKNSSGGSDVTPSGCSNSNQVIAYATGDTATGLSTNPYHWTYRGILMCGRTDWTNHASLARYHDDLILAFHDGPSGNHQRRVMLDCLTWDSSGHFKKVPNSSNNFQNCANW